MNGMSIVEYWIANDVAYICSEYLLTSYTKSQLIHPELGPRHDAFNFFPSSLRIHIEQSFEILVVRFGILWRLLKVPLAVVPRILSACTRIPNFCIEQGLPPLSQIQEPAAVSDTEADFTAWLRNAEEVRDPGTQQGRRSDLAAGAKRDGLSDLLHTRGFHRPKSI
jgi:DDE superfamily endonuclease